MSNTVYDTTLVAYANGAIAGRKPGNVLDRRLRSIEKFLQGTRVAWSNTKLQAEYFQKIKEHRNDVIEAFFIRLVDHGRLAKRNTLSRQEYARAKKLGWPSHDQHLLAAALEAGAATICVTENSLAVCAAGLRREFTTAIEHIA